jgi:hypothetical protein
MEDVKNVGIAVGLVIVACFLFDLVAYFTGVNTSAPCVTAVTHLVQELARVLINVL